jgi:hypothetical protein
VLDAFDRRDVFHIAAATDDDKFRRAPIGKAGGLVCPTKTTQAGLTAERARGLGESCAGGVDTRAGLSSKSTETPRKPIARQKS